MIRFLAWLRAIFFSVINGAARIVMALLLLIAILFIVSLAYGDGLPGNMVLSLDLREAIDDSRAAPTSLLTPRRATVMDVVLGLDTAGRDSRVKGVIMRLGNGAISTAEAQEIGAAIKRFKAKNKFVIADATAFFGAGMGDYLTASAASEIWVQPKSPFSVAGAGGGELFLRGTLEKLKAEPQMVKRAEYKSAADMFMEKQMTPQDREQLTALFNSVYDGAVKEMAANRKITASEVIAALEASPQFAEDALSRRLVDHIGFEDEARAAAAAKAGSGAKQVKFATYVRDTEAGGGKANIAIVEGAGEIRDGTAKTSWVNSSTGIASDDFAAAVTQAAKDDNIKAIVLRVDSPGGSVTASDQILHAVKEAQRKGKPVVVMGGVAASGGYYISLSANRIVAQPGTITGSIGVLTGKVSFAGTLGLAGANAEMVSVGKNTLMDSPLQAFTPEQLANLNHQADVIYDDFTSKVAAGRKLPLDKVRQVARGRVWSGTDAKTQGLVDELGGFWTAAGAAAGLAKVAPENMVFKVYPRPTGLLARLSGLSEGFDASLAMMGRVESLMRLPAVDALVMGAESLPGQGPGGTLQLKAGPLPRP